MTEQGLPSEPKMETAAKRSERATVRRRWIGLAELVGIAALSVSAGGLWLAWSERRSQQAEKANESAEKSLITFTASRSGRGAVLELHDTEHRIQQIDVSFPPTLGVPVQVGLIEPHISAKWFDEALLRSTEKAGVNREGKLPVMVTTTWWDGNQRKIDRAIYQVGWRSGKRLFRGRSLDLEGASLAERGGTPARLDALWKAVKPAN